jgi:hypothetical protein
MERALTGYCPRLSDLWDSSGSDGSLDSLGWSGSLGSQDLLGPQGSWV